MSAQRAYRSPLLVLLDTGSANRWSSYIQEILDIDGFFARDVVDLATGNLADVPLHRYETMVVANLDLSDDEQDLLRRYVSDGGNLIALRPPKSMADLFGLQPNESIANTRVKDRYIVLVECHHLANELLCRSIQFRGDMDLYRAGDAAVLARVAGDLDDPTGFAAISTRCVGRGKVAAFAYDLATTVVRLHQGDAANASTGTNPDPDSDDRWAPNDLFVGRLDPRLKLIPQADVHQDLLVRVITWMSEQGRPVPRAWYFPDASPSIAYLNGDSDGMDREDYDAVRSRVEDAGGRFTLYLLENHRHLFTPDDIERLRESGHAFGNHVDLPMMTSVDDARRLVARSTLSFTSAFGFRPLTTRGHCLVWPGWTDMAEILAVNGVRMDQDFIPRRFLQHGYLNGSGLPVKFMRQDGELLDIYEQNTQITDDGSVEQDKFLIRTGNPENVLQTALSMLDDCIDRFHGVFQAAFHPHLTMQRALWLLEGVLAHIRERGIPMVSGDEWVQFNDARRTVRIDDVRFECGSGAFQFRAKSRLPIRGLTLMLPADIESRRVSSIDVDGDPSPYSIQRLKGSSYVLVVVNIEEGGEVLVNAQYR